MRKAIIPIAAFVFLVSASPAYAAPWDNWSFDSFFSYITSAFVKPAPPIRVEPIFPSVTPDVNNDITGIPARPVTPRTLNPNDTPTPTWTTIQRPKTTPGGVHLPVITGRPTFIPDRPTGNIRPSGYVRPTSGPDGTNRTQQISDVIKRLLDSYKQRLDQYGQFLSKITSRRDTLKAQGADVTRLDAFIQTAVDNLHKAQAQFASLEAVLLNMNLNTDMRIIRQTIQNELTKMRQAMTILHTSMSQVVAEIVALSIRPTDSITGRPTGLPERIITGRPTGFPTQRTYPSVSPKGGIYRPGI